MTDDKDRKRLVRQRMAKTGETYSTARANLFSATDVTDVVERFRDERYALRGMQGLARHLERRYGIDVAARADLDNGVVRISHAAGEWVARVFPKARPIDAVAADAQILRVLAEREIPAERCAHDEPVSELDGQAVLVTEWIRGANARNDVSGETLSDLGDLLGRVHTLAVDGAAMSRKAGSWHHLAANGGGRDADVATLEPLLAAASSRVAPEDRALFDGVVAALREVEDGSGLPTAFIHPDPCGANAISADDGRLALIDWAGAGEGPRVTSFATLVAGSLQTSPGVAPSRDLRRVDAVVAGYRRHVQLSSDELERLPGALTAFGIVLDCWSFVFHGAGIGQISRSIDVRRAIADETAQRVVQAFDADPSSLTWWEEPARPPVVDEGQAQLF
jgi:Ser/Thr protein kinase RdoA (MazF antagonist)